MSSFFGWVIETAILIMPAWAWLAISAAGVVLYYASGLISAFPQFKPYALVIKILGVLAMFGGVFMYGGEGVSAIWQEQIKEMAAKVAEAEAKSGKVNTVIREKVVKEIQIIKETTNANNQAIEARRDSINAECRLSDDAWMLYNQSTKNAVAPGSNRALGTSK
jgi:Zn finger protein HypA/HybF involved in hydrogenase expression